MANNPNIGTQQLYMNNWNQQQMVPAVLMQADDPQNPNNPLGIDAGRARALAAIQPQSDPNPTANPVTGLNPFTMESQSTFGTPNWDWINFSNTVRSGLSYAGNYFGNSRQNAVQDYNREKLNPLNYLSETSNVSNQDRYGTSYYDDGGTVEEDDEDDFIFGSSEVLSAPSDKEPIIKNKKQVRAEREAADQAVRELDEANANTFYESLSFNKIAPSDPVQNPYTDNSAPQGFAGIFANEGAATGQPTNLNSSAIGRGQMIKSTREMMYKQMGITDIGAAEKQFKTDPDFEMSVLNQYRQNLDKQIPANITGAQREYQIAKGWYTGNVNFPDNQVPHPEAGNKLTARQYAQRALQKQELGGMIYKQDQEYDVSPAELKRLKDLGYTVEIL